jgi:hypothetical protein
MANEPNPPVLTRTALVCAVVVLVLYLVFTLMLLLVAGDSSQLTWDRYIFVYGGLEAVVFGAAGALFGTKVQRAQTAKAEQRAEANQADAEAGRALRKAVETEESFSNTDSDSASRSGGLATGRIASPGAGGEPIDDLLAVERLAELARRLFDDG